MDIRHELRDGLVRSQRHADLDGNTGVGNVGRRAMADAVRPDMRYLCAAQDALPAVVIRAVRQWLLGIKDGRTHVRRAVDAGRIEQQLVRRLAHRLGHIARLAVRPDDSAILEIDPSPFERADFGHARGKLELQANRQRHGRMLQPLGIRTVEVSIEPPQFLVVDVPRLAVLAVLGDVTARIGAVRPVAPHLGHVEHLAQTGQNPIGRDADPRLVLHQRGDVRPRYVRHLELAQGRQDVAVDVALVGIDRPGLVARLGVFLDELPAQFLDRRGHARGQLGGAGVVALAHVGQPVLCDRPCLLDGQLAELADLRLAALAPVRAVLEHEDLAAVRGDFAEKAGDNGVPQFIVLAGNFCRIDSGFGEFDLGHDTS